MTTYGCKRNFCKKYVEIEDLVREHEITSRSALHLVPTENLLSPLAKTFLMSDGSSRYALENPRNAVGWYLAGEDKLNEIERITRKNVKTLFNANYSNIAPLSGINCMSIMLSGLKLPKQVLFTMPMKFGGHECTVSIAKRFGIKSGLLSYDENGLVVDVERSAKKINKSKNAHIYLDSSMILFPHPIKELRKELTTETIITYDGSQIMGLIAGGLFQKPLKEGADFLCGSVHKSFFGPQKAIIVGKKNSLSKNLEIALSQFVSNKHMGDVISFSISVLEMLEFGTEYARQCVKNSKALAEGLYCRGFKVQAEELGFTESNQIWVDVGNDVYKSKRVLFDFAKANIFINLTRIPSLGGKPGWRIGTQELTRLGMRENEMDLIASFISDIFIGKKSSSVVRKDVDLLRKNFSIPKYCVNPKKKHLKTLFELFSYY